MRKSFSLMNLSANFDATTEIADHNMDSTFEEITKYNGALSVGDSVENDNHTFVSISETLMRDPIWLRQKGQTYGKMKEILEKKKRKARKVGVSNSQIPQTAMTGKKNLLFIQNSICKYGT
uniref:Uncharacterized protein n=1 Tax=Davidia involucrata TaxID=16924 RepID=A0A5B7AXY4_DAVIN